LWDLVQEGNTHLMGLSKIRYLAIDETNRMVEKGCFEELLKILDMLRNRSKSHNREAR
jgi:ATP-dependent RNA helicase DDX24/MAK5